MSASSTALRAFLAHPDRPAGTLGYAELHGFLFAVANAPELIMPSEWVPALFDGQEVVFADADEAEIVQGALMEEYNEVCRAALEESLPPGCVLRDDPMANLEDDAPIGGWARGFMEGHDWLAEIWDEYIPESGDDDASVEELSEELGSLLTVLSFFGSRSLAEAFRGEMQAPPDLSELAKQMHALLPNAVREYAALGRSIQAAVDELERAPYRRDEPKIGRNDPCPCGSGRKYKRCCGDTTRVQ